MTRIENMTDAQGNAQGDRNLVHTWPMLRPCSDIANYSEIREVVSVLFVQFIKPNEVFNVHIKQFCYFQQCFQWGL